jgi:hypothetical protein
MLLVCQSIHHVMKAEQLLRDAGIVPDMIPVPREISSDCGMCLAIDNADVADVEALLDRRGFPHPWKIYPHPPANGGPKSPHRFT